MLPGQKSRWLILQKEKKTNQRSNLRKCLKIEEKSVSPEQTSVGEAETTMDSGKAGCTGGHEAAAEVCGAQDQEPYI